MTCVSKENQSKKSNCSTTIARKYCRTLVHAHNFKSENITDKPILYYLATWDRRTLAQRAPYEKTYRMRYIKFTDTEIMKLHRLAERLYLTLEATECEKHDIRVYWTVAIHIIMYVLYLANKLPFPSLHIIIVPGWPTPDLTKNMRNLRTNYPGRKRWTGRSQFIELHCGSIYMKRKKPDSRMKALHF